MNTKKDKNSNQFNQENIKEYLDKNNISEIFNLPVDKNSNYLKLTLFDLFLNLYFEVNYNFEVIVSYTDFKNTYIKFLSITFSIYDITNSDIYTVIGDQYIRLIVENFLLKHKKAKLSKRPNLWIIEPIEFVSLETNSNSKNLEKELGKN